jgi:hypothetical protein
MKRPATASIVVFVAVILVAAVIAGALWFGTDGSTAITVGDAKVSAQSVNDELRVVAGAQTAQATTNGSVDSQLSAQIASQIVYEHLIDQYLAKVGDGITGADRTAARAQISDKTFTKLPKWFQDRYVARFAAFAALSRLKGDPNDQNAEVRAVRRLARHTTVTVDPVYGRWTPAQAQVVPWPTPAELQAGG